MRGCLELGSVGMEHDNHCISITAIGNKFVAHCCVNSLLTFQLVWAEDPFNRQGEVLNVPICYSLLLPYGGLYGRLTEEGRVALQFDYP